MPLLSAEAFAATFAETMRDVTREAEPVCDVWDYVEAIPDAELDGLVPQDVAYVYRARDAYDHVVIATETLDVFLVVVVDLQARAVAGHHILDVAAQYGIEPA